MGLYNMLYGVNGDAPLLLAMLGIDQPDGKWQSGRFRDIYLNGSGTEIWLYTRNGGGNRQHWGYDDNPEGGPECRCPGCIITYHLPQHPNYLRDFDDDFDSTYATVVFEAPEQYRELTAAMATGEDPASIGARFQETLRELQALADKASTK